MLQRNFLNLDTPLAAERVSTLRVSSTWLQGERSAVEKELQRERARTVVNPELAGRVGVVAADIRFSSLGIEEN